VRKLPVFVIHLEAKNLLLVPHFQTFALHELYSELPDKEISHQNKFQQNFEVINIFSNY
jgi:hypothetical protein